MHHTHKSNPAINSWCPCYSCEIFPVNSDLQDKRKDNNKCAWFSFHELILFIMFLALFSIFPIKNLPFFFHQSFYIHFESAWQAPKYRDTQTHLNSNIDFTVQVSKFRFLYLSILPYIYFSWFWRTLECLANNWNLNANKLTEKKIHEPMANMLFFLFSNFIPLSIAKFR